MKLRPHRGHGITGLLLLALGGTALPAQAIQQELPPGGGAIADWLVVGPFPNSKLPELAEDGSGRSGWNVDFLAPVGGESSPRLEEGVSFSVETEQGTVEVTPRRGRTGFWATFDMLLGLGMEIGDGDFKLAYAYTEVVVEEPGNHLFLLGADDAAKFYVNGELVFSEWNRGQGVNPGQYRFFRELNEGPNSILVKLDNNTGPWGFSLEIAHEREAEALIERLKTGPVNFSRFHFEGFPEESQLLSRYNWYFFFNSMLTMHTLFVREYMTMADIWRGNAVPRSGQGPIQEVLRQWWRDTRQDPDGYIQTHQHFSHSHDGGWPFPLWPQIWGGWPGYTAGWHFQDFGPGWVWEYRMVLPNTPQTGQMATEAWRVEGATSHGMTGNFWTVTMDSPRATLTSPEGTVIDAQNSPFIQIRWRRNGTPRHGVTPYIEWKRAGDDEWSADRRMLVFDYNSEFAEATGFRHSIIPLNRHPDWEGQISEFRFVLAPGETGIDVEIDSIFTCYDTRKAYNNLFFVSAAWEYFRWTGDVDFLNEEINRLRLALRYAQDQFSTRELGHIRNQWIGHDGLAGWYDNEDGERVGRPGHGIGNNYYDLLPFGWDDMYNTAQYYNTVLAMAELEELIARNPGWALPEGGLAFDPQDLRAHAARVKEVANEKFWNEETGRFFGSFDVEGRGYDFGFTFVGLEAIHYGIASEERARSVMDWISGRRIVEGDTSVGEDIYYFRFGPRATTRRNIEWYGQGWTRPESIAFGRQIQDGGAVLGMTFYDLEARLKVYGPDDAWNRFKEIMEWEAEVREAGGYRDYYATGNITMQGGGTAGGIGIDFEFLESSLLPLIVPRGFLGLDPRGDRLRIAPRLPSEVPSMTLTSILYQGIVLDMTATHESVSLTFHDAPIHPLRITFDEERRHGSTVGTEFIVDSAGEHVFELATVVP